MVAVVGGGSDATADAVAQAVLLTEMSLLVNIINGYIKHSNYFTIHLRGWMVRGNKTLPTTRVLWSEDKTVRGQPRDTVKSTGTWMMGRI